jgi:hypothetical protein
MGGQDGNRGYMLQAIVAVLESLSKDDWEYVALEPDESNQKVDIQWWDKEEKISVYQVKSSINNFDKADILNILHDLTITVPAADSFSLILIGTYSGDTVKFFKSFKAKSKQDFGKWQSLFDFKEKITVNLKALDIPGIDGQTENEIHKFISSYGYLVLHPVIQLICLGLHAQFTRFATEGKKISRLEFQLQILDWMKFNYPKELKLENERLNLAFYKDKSIDETGFLNHQMYLNDVLPKAIFNHRIAELLELAERITAITLPQSMIQVEVANPFKLSYISSPLLSEGPANLEDTEIIKISSLAKEFLGISFNDDFFNVGNVKYAPFTTTWSFIGNQSRFNGTKEEIEKRELLGNFEYKLESLKELRNCCDQIGLYRVLPLILVNDGDVLQTRVELQMSLPDEVIVLSEITFPKMDNNANMELFSHEADNAYPLFTIAQNTKIKAYDNRNIPPFNMPIYDPIWGKQKSEYQRLLKQSLKLIFDYDIYSDTIGKQTLICTFKSIKPKDAMALPSYLLVFSDCDFEIDYLIKSDQTGGSSSKLTITYN